jgi:hypothetical protein
MEYYCNILNTITQGQFSEFVELCVSSTVRYTTHNGRFLKGNYASRLFGNQEEYMVNFVNHRWSYIEQYSVDELEPTEIEPIGDNPYHPGRMDVPSLRFRFFLTMSPGKVKGELCPSFSREILADDYDQTRRYKSIFALESRIPVIDWIDGSFWTDIYEGSYNQDYPIPVSGMLPGDKVPTFVNDVFHQETERLEEIQARPEGPEGLELRRIQAAQRRDLVIVHLRNNHRVALPILAPAPAPAPVPVPVPYHFDPNVRAASQVRAAAHARNFPQIRPDPIVDLPRALDKSEYENGVRTDNEFLKGPRYLDILKNSSDEGSDTNTGYDNKTVD